MQPEINVLALHHTANSERLRPEPRRPLLSPRPSLVPEGHEGPKCSGDRTKCGTTRTSVRVNLLEQKTNPKPQAHLACPLCMCSALPGERILCSRTEGKIYNPHFVEHIINRIADSSG